jgi:Holliday junction DNA helicase, RuvA subunit
MISYIKGMVADITDNAIIMECGGIGYHIFTTVSALSGEVCIGEELIIHTYLQVKEDDMQLYGFLDKDDLRLFKLLISVNGIGPKVGLGILSGLSADEIRFAILSDDATTISKAPGIGKKTAQKLILELKDKLNLQDAFEQKLENQSVGGKNSSNEAQKEVVEALAALGYSGAEALKAVKQVDSELQADVGQLLKAALKIIR